MSKGAEREQTVFANYTAGPDDADLKLRVSSKRFGRSISPQHRPPHLLRGSEVDNIIDPGATGISFPSSGCLPQESSNSHLLCN